MSIRINDLTVRFKNGVVAVNKASLEIPKGIYGLLGENGHTRLTLHQNHKKIISMLRSASI